MVQIEPYEEELLDTERPLEFFVTHPRGRRLWHPRFKVVV